MKIKVFPFFLLLFVLGMSLKSSAVEVSKNETSLKKVSGEDFCLFLNQEAQYDFAHLYDEKEAASILRTGIPGSYRYCIIPQEKDLSVTYVDQRSAMQYRNWKKEDEGQRDVFPFLINEKASVMLRSEGLGCIDDALRSNTLVLYAIDTNTTVYQSGGAEVEVANDVINDLLKFVFAMVTVSAATPEATIHRNDLYQDHETVTRDSVMNAPTMHERGSLEHKIFDPSPRDAMPQKSALKKPVDVSISATSQEVSLLKAAIASDEGARSSKIVRFDFLSEGKREQILVERFLQKRSKEQKHTAQLSRQFKLLTSGIEIAIDDTPFPAETADYATHVAGIYEKNYPLLKGCAQHLLELAQSNPLFKDRKTACLLGEATIHTLEAALKSANLGNFVLIKAKEYNTTEIPQGARTLFSFASEEEIEPDDIEGTILLRSTGRMIDSLNALLNTLKEKRESKIPELFYKAQKKNAYRRHRNNTDPGIYFHKKKTLLAPKEHEEPSKEYQEACAAYQRIKDYLKNCMSDYQKVFNTPCTVTPNEAKKSAVQELMLIPEEALAIANQLITMVALRKSTHQISMNIINPHNNQPLFSTEHLQRLAPEEQMNHIGEHIDALVGYMEGIEIALNPDHGQHQEVQNHIENLAHHHETILQTFADHTEENPTPFNHAIVAAHGALHFMIQHHGPGDHLPEVADPINQNIVHDSDDDASSQGTRTTIASEESSNASGASGGGMQVHPI